MFDYQTLLVDVKDKVGTIRLNRPESLNAYTSIMCTELVSAMGALDADDGVAVIVVTGEGRAFCAGADVSDGDDHFADRPDEEPVARANPWLARPWELRTPIIAAINGPAVGIGLTMTLAFDIRLATTDAKLGFVFTRRGLTPEAYSSWILPRLIGMSRASELMLSGRYFSGEEAAEWGLVSKHLSTDDLLPYTYALANDLAANTSPIAVAATKRLLWQQLETRGVVESLAYEQLTFDWIRQQPDCREGVAAFIGRRAPVWPSSKSLPLPQIDDK